MQIAHTCLIIHAGSCAAEIKLDRLAISAMITLNSEQFRLERAVKILSQPILIAFDFVK